MAETVDIIEKLIQLALKNPNREEAASAALKAVALIDKFQIPIGANITIVREVSEWIPPDPNFMNVVADILKGRSPDDPAVPRASGGSSSSLMITDNELVDPHEAWRQRMIDAWRAIREERKRMEGEVYRYEQETKRKFWGDGLRHW